MSEVVLSDRWRRLRNGFTGIVIFCLLMTAVAVYFGVWWFSVIEMVLAGASMNRAVYCHRRIARAQADEAWSEVLQSTIDFKRQNP